ncbi:hypothetical protein GGC64_003616 [Mycobacterium sp. OAS707]|uniref:hypothetical protein n=1 Tax=Mycobacterium sp. OAS707 TaxID=2663822 RepID=UPI001789287F|nr:hypothetical protein [Mycobacterium sp. OAS707]MBE1549592.1 hypothetical protein [Mycobacterium sp. OAS707]
MSVIRLKSSRRGYRRIADALATALTLAILCDPVSQADPLDTPIAPNPYPKDSLILTTYTRLDPADYFLPGLYGVYFLSPSGLNCGIWLRGSFGCAGPLPGASGAAHIGWFNGDTRVHYDPFIAIGFPDAQAQRVLPPRSYLNWNETTCVTMADTSTYCHRGMFRFLITPSATFLNG